MRWHNDKEGEDGFMRLLWNLCGVSNIDVKLGWSRQMYVGRFNGRQPESLTPDELNHLRSEL